MNVLETALHHPQINTLDYWTNDPTHIEVMRASDVVAVSYLITHESDNLEICLVTGANRSFVRDTRNGATMYKAVQPSLCLAVEAYISRRKETFSV